MKKILTYIALLLITSTTFAQNYPVQSTVQITPPYSVYLSDYASIGSDKLMVTLMLKDINQQDLQVKLRIRIKGSGIELRTKADYQPLPIILQGGVPLQLSGTDLESYFNPQNLDFTGISKQAFNKTGKLPEGVYQFTVEAVEYRRGATVSNAIPTIGWLVLNDPPRWTLPMANSLLTASYPQNIFFSWMPMSTASPNAAFTTEYEFTIVELWPDNRAPGDAINSSAPLFQTTSINTSLVYGPAEPELTPGRKYVCRIRAYDTEGRDLFKNNGYSEILTFTYGQACKPPTNFTHKVLNQEEAKVNWTSLPGNTAFTLSYSEKNQDGTWSNWYHNENMTPWSKIEDLKAEHIYRYKIKATCGTIESDYSKTKEFATPAQDTSEAECGKDASIPKIDNSPPLQSLKPGDKINVGGFTATIIEAEGSGGTFTGKCVVNVKTFGGVRVLSEFNGISINESYQVTAGEINSVKGELNIIGLDDILGGKEEDEGEEENNENNNNPNVGNPYQPGDEVTIILDGQEYIVAQDTTIITANGDTIVANFGQQPPIIVVNNETTDVNTDKLDFDNPGGGTGSNVAGAVSDTTVYVLNLVEFKEYQNPTGINFGFDAYPPEIKQYLNEYKKKKVLEQDYIIPWQSAEADGKPAQVNMLIKTKVPDSINTRLKVEMEGMPLSFVANPDGDTLRILNLTGQGHKDKDLITASYLNDEGKEIPIGYLNLKSYNRQNFNLVIVPVDGKYNYSESSLQNYLNKVYAPAITSWEVELIDPLVVDYDEGEKNGLNTSRTLISKFNKEMNAVIEAMENRGDYNKENYYLFVMDKAENESLNGLMPFNSHYGFLFTGDNPGEDKLFRTIAHELGHGPFKLKHNFDDKGTEKRSTQNMMDYTNTPETATILRKYQWDEIISPRLIALGWSEEKYAETSASIYDFAFIEPADPEPSNSKYELYQKTDNRLKRATIPKIPGANGQLSFISPTGKIITLPSDAYDFSFNGGKKKGILIAFSMGDSRYCSSKKGNDGLFYGYVKARGKISNEELKSLIYYDKYSKDLGATTKIYYGYINKTNPANKCEIELRTADYPVGEVSENYYGGFKLSFKSYNDISQDLKNNKLYDSGGGINTDDLGYFPSPYICPCPAPILAIEKYELSSDKIAEVHVNWEAEGNTLFVIRKESTVSYVVHQVDNDGSDIYWQWDKLHGWVYAKFKPHEGMFDGFGPALLKFLTSAEILHGTLDVIGFIPVIGEAGDFIHGIWYSIEGDKTNAVISFAAMIPLIGDAGKVGKYTVKVGKVLKATKAGKYVIKSIDEIPTITKIGEFATKAIKDAGIAKDAIKSAVDQMTSWITKHGANAQFFVKKIIATHNAEVAIALTKAINDLPAGKLKTFFEKVALKKISKVDDAFLLCNNIEKLSPDLIKVWADLVDAYPNFANNIDNLINLNKILKSEKLTQCGLATSDIWTIVKNMKNANQAAPELGEFLIGMNKLIEAGTKFDNIAPAISDLAKAGTNFPQGFGWTLTYITKNSDEFAGKTLKFENPVKTAEGLRKIDVSIISNKPSLYEFKSVIGIPPTHFPEQILKDLSNGQVTNLNQIKWLFDKRKLKNVIKLEDAADVTAKFKEPLMKVLDDMLENGKITDDMARRILNTQGATATKLIDEIDEIFGNIFKIK